MVVPVTQIDRRGRVQGTAPAGTRVGRLEVLRLGTVVAQLDGANLQIERFFCDLGVLEPRGEQLVIVALAPGVSAVELQALVEPLLMITHEVEEMVLDGTIDGLAG